jgi:hypothetical protein
MRTVVITFFLPDGKVFHTVSIGTHPFTCITADTAFRIKCKAVVYLDGGRMPEEATTTAQLFDLLNQAAAQGYPTCSACAE